MQMIRSESVTKDSGLIPLSGSAEKKLKFSAKKQEAIMTNQNSTYVRVNLNFPI